MQWQYAIPQRKHLKLEEGGVGGEGGSCCPLQRSGSPPPPRLSSSFSVCISALRLKSPFSAAGLAQLKNFERKSYHF